jgi:Phosphotransferase enzyme family
VDPTPEQAANVRRALKKLRSDVVSWSPVSRGGYTPARRWVVALEDGRTVFVKIATDELTASWLRDEHVAYSVLRGAPFMPGYVGFYDDGEHPVLALEDLSAGRWPPPWDGAMVDAVLDALRDVAATTPPAATARAVDDERELARGWDDIANDPSPFLALELADGAWLAANLSTLREAAREVRLDGEALLHFDVRSDNTCVRDGRAVFVDWNLTTIGNPQIDIAFWLPSLQAEGGPAPEDVLPEADGALVAVVAGFFCSRASGPPIPTAPRVREIQLVQARTALPWAARVLGLPEPAVPG